MNRRTPASLAALTQGPKESRFTDFESSGSSSTLGSLEMQARWITASAPRTDAFTAARSRTSPFWSVNRGWFRTAAKASSP